MSHQQEVIPIMEPYIDREALAQLLDLSVATIDRFVAEGMPSETWGLRARRFKPSAALAWLNERGKR